MNVEGLAAYLSQLHEVAASDPLLALCSTIAWLDPLQPYEDTFFEEEMLPYADELDHWSNIAQGWSIARACYPEVYVETTLALRGGMPPEKLSNQVRDGFNRHQIGGEIDDLYQIHYGLPFFGMGIDITEPDFFESSTFAPLSDLYPLFGIDVATCQYGLPDHFFQSAQIADALATSLRQTEDATYSHVAWLLDWMFGQTGNTCADYTNNDFWETGIEPLAWETDNVRFNELMHQEALDILAFAQQGLNTLLADPALRDTVRSNAQHVQKLLQKGNPHDRSNRPHAERLAIGLRWPDRVQPVDADPTSAHVESLPVWRADAA